MPASTQLNFSYPQQQSISIKIFTTAGWQMAAQILQNSTCTSFDVHNYPPGIYWYHAVTNGISQTGKFVITKE